MIFEYILNFLGYNCNILDYYKYVKDKLLSKNTSEYKFNTLINLYNLYSLSILLILIIRPIYILLYTPYNSLTCISSFNYLLVPLQYYLGIKYFGKAHFNNTMEKTDWYNSFMQMKISSIIISITFICIICNTILVKKELIYHIAINIIINIYSWLCIMTNLIGFILVFYYHTKQLKNLSDTISNKNWNDVESNNNISVIIYRLSVIRNDYNCSIDLLNNIFASACILGGISTYEFLKLIIKGIKLNIAIYINIGLYCLIQLIFIFIIVKLNNSIDNIKKIVHSPIFVKKYLGREEQFKELHKLANDGSMSEILDYENASSIDWLILTTQLDKEWNDFTLLGFKVKDELFKRFFALIGIFISINNYSLFN